MFALFLNPVTGKAEQYNCVAFSQDEAALRQWLTEQTAPEPYKDDSFIKTYKKDSVLEMYNPPQMDGENTFGVLEGICQVMSESDMKKYLFDFARNWRDTFGGAYDIDNSIFKETP